MMGLSCLLLAYSAYVVPMQLSFWITDDLCNPFPTLYSDIVVDTYFLVRSCGFDALSWFTFLAGADMVTRLAHTFPSCFHYQVCVAWLRVLPA
jgi:hypothetical protein